MIITIDTEKLTDIKKGIITGIQAMVEHLNTGSDVRGLKYFIGEYERAEKLQDTIEEYAQCCATWLESVENAAKKAEKEAQYTNEKTKKNTKRK